ncbi:MAG: tetratricopeptide repeat protein, partial [Cyanobacteria bacterium P01_F01_bin.42]
IIDPNRQTSLNRDQLKDLARELKNHSPTHPEAEHYSLRRLGEGLNQALKVWSRLEPDLLGWIYEAAQGSIGFGGVPGGPWTYWEKRIDADVKNAAVLKSGMQALGLQQTPTAWTAHRLDLEDWLVMGMVLQWMQRGLVAWFDKQAYDPKAGPKLSISVYLSFTVLWYELAYGYQRSSGLNVVSRERYEQASLQVSLQLLRTFARQPYFPLYGGIFAAFSGGYLKMTLDYLNIPLKWVEGIQEKARILTLLGTSQQQFGQVEKAIAFYQEALELAREAKDYACEIANLNHLSRSSISQDDFETAVNQAQRALLLSRQHGDVSGQANALVNLGYAQVLRAQTDERPDLDGYEIAMGYLEQGLNLAERKGDRQSEALACVSLGIAYSVQEKYGEAIATLEQGLKALDIVGDLALRSRVYQQLAEAHYALGRLEQASLYGVLGMYLLHQTQSPLWRQAAGLLTVIQGQNSAEFNLGLEKNRATLISVIGVDGYDSVSELLEQYRQS